MKKSKRLLVSNRCDEMMTTMMMMDDSKQVPKSFQILK